MMNEHGSMMMDGMTSGPMMWAMGGFWLLLAVALLLAIAALVKYLLPNPKPAQGGL